MTGRAYGPAGRQSPCRPTHLASAHLRYLGGPRLRCDDAPRSGGKAISGDNIVGVIGAGRTSSCGRTPAPSPTLAGPSRLEGKKCRDLNQPPSHPSWR